MIKRLVKAITNSRNSDIVLGVLWLVSSCFAFYGAAAEAIRVDGGSELITLLALITTLPLITVLVVRVVNQRLSEAERDLSHCENKTLLALELIASGMPMTKACLLINTKVNSVSRHLNHKLVDGEFDNLKQRANASIIERANHNNYKSYTTEQLENIAMLAKRFNLDIEQ